MKIARDSNDLPAATRLDTWRGMLCDTFMGIDCRLPETFRSVIEGYAVGGHTLTRITSTPHAVERSPTLIKRDGREMVFFGVLLSGKAVNIQAGREAVLERGAVVVSDTSRPFQTRVDAAADIIWISVPKKPMAERLRGLEDRVAISLRPSRSIVDVASSLMAGLDETLARGLPAPDAERLTTQLLDTLALTILGSEPLPDAEPSRRDDRGPIH